MPKEKTVKEFRIHNLPSKVVFWLCRCAELEGCQAEDSARAILEREWRRFNVTDARSSAAEKRGGYQ